MEIIDRELNGIVLLCHEALSRGWQCIIGTKKPIYSSLAELPPSIFFLKSITRADLANIKKIKAHGHKVVSLDVEGLVYADLYEFVTVRFHKETMDETDAIMFWGNIQKDAIVEAYPDYAHKCVTTGSPIVDFWKPECGLQDFYHDDVDMLRSRFGSFVLIPSSFGLPNHKMGKQAATSIIERDEMIDECEREAFLAHWRGYEQHIDNVFERFLKLLPALALNFPDTTFIIRPHPAEKHETWIEIAKEYSNIQVIYEGVVSPWLLAADAVLHWGCTTGIEAFLMGRPVVAYNPILPHEEKYDHKLPHSVSIETRTQEDCLNALRDVLSKPTDLFTRYPSLELGAKEFEKWSYTPPSGLAAKAVMDVIARHEIGPYSINVNQFSERFCFKDAIWKGLEKIDRLFGGGIPFPKHIRLTLDSRAYGRQKARDLGVEEVHSVWFKLISILSSNTKAKIFALKKGVYLFEPQNKNL